MSAGLETRRLQDILNMRGIAATWDDANTLRRAQITLQRWAEGECGNGNDYASWAIERDEQTGLPYRCVYPHSGKNYRTRIADKEKGALARVKAVCERLGCYWYHQTDPRGCSLYVSADPIHDNDYTRGTACVVCN